MDPQRDYQFVPKNPWKLKKNTLITTVDVVLEGFRPGVMARLGLDPQALLEEHPHLIVASITGFGQDGAWRHRPGHDLGYMGLSGLLAMNARRGEAARPLSGRCGAAS